MTRVTCGLLLGLMACGGAPPLKEPKTADDAAAPESAQPSSADEASDDAEAAAPPAAGMPTECAKQSGDVCLPKEKFARALCDKDYPTIALAMFVQGTVWTRGYLTRKTKAWNASGGGSSNEQMAFDEEVLVLRHRAAAADGVQISGMGDSYDVLRWDGGCVTLGQGELTMRKPPKPKSARIVWKRLEVDVRDTLKRKPELRELYLKHRKECKGVSMGVVSKACVKVDGEFSRAIAKYVRDGGEVPTPQKLP